MRSTLRAGMVPVLASMLLALGWSGSATAEPRGKTSFKDDVFPILQYRCGECHKAGGEGMEQSGLNLETYEGLMQGTRFGPVVIPGDSVASNLNVLVEGRAVVREEVMVDGKKVVRERKGNRMPHNKRPLTPCEIDVLKSWVNQGAKNN
ncbi:MAG: hypothetical protein HQL57_09635 [Magnetococcales bacterium]|nr:hypothetical protein [Magnetococcales bacterium]MBF0157431.1 hypothetical protein [Magnetococcales bacterium]